VKLDPHVHTTFSARTSLYPLRHNRSLLFDLVARPANAAPQPTQR
jgi:hypothetical protein